MLKDAKNIIKSRVVISNVRREEDDEHTRTKDIQRLQY